MGGCHSVTVKEVTEDLENSLLISATSLYQEKFGGSLAPGSSLEDYAKALAVGQFKDLFHYDWAETSDNCKPPNVDPNDPRVRPVTDYCIIAQDHDLQKGIKDYVDGGLSGASLDKWMQNKATADLTAIVTKYLDYPVDTTWHYGSANEAYDAANPDEDSYKLDLSFIYTNATHTESCVEVTLHIMYFVGVYYTVTSPKATTFAALRGNAYNSAGSLPNVTQKPVNDDNQLAAALQQYGNPLFKTQYGYEYASGTPNDAAKDESSPIFARNAYLVFLPTKGGLTDDQLSAYINLHIVSGFGLPTDGELNWNALITKTLKEEVRNIIDNAAGNAWKNVAVNTSYGLKMASVRPVKLNAMINTWYGTQTISVNNQDVQVEVVYLHIFGLVYELQEDPILQDLKHAIVKNIPDVNVSSIPPRITAPALQQYTRTWNISEFKRAFQIDYPSGQSSDPHFSHWQAYFEFDKWYPLEADIKTKIENQIFGPDSTKNEQIHHNLQQSVYNNLVKLFADFSGTGYAKDNNEWYGQTKQTSYPYKGKHNDDWTLDVKTSFAYCNATFTEDSRGGETIKYFYLDLLVYANATSESGSSSEV